MKGCKGLRVKVGSGWVGGGGGGGEMRGGECIPYSSVHSSTKLVPVFANCPLYILAFINKISSPDCSYVALALFYPPASFVVGGRNRSSTCTSMVGLTGLFTSTTSCKLASVVGMLPVLYRVGLVDRALQCHGANSHGRLSCPCCHWSSVFTHRPRLPAYSQ